MQKEYFYNYCIGPGIIDGRIAGKATDIDRFKRKEHGMKEMGERIEYWSITNLYRI